MTRPVRWLRPPRPWRRISGRGSRSTKNLAGCEKLGEVLARRLKDRNIEKIVFDRGVYPYHGRVKAVAEAMRKGGLVF